MTKLTKDILRTYELGDLNEVPVLGGEIIYQGAAIGIEPESGYARGLQAGDKFAGFAENHIDASSFVDGQKNIKLRKRGSVILEVSNASLTDFGKAVYATDDNSFTLSETNAVYIGKISRFESYDKVIVDFDLLQLESS